MRLQVDNRAIPGNQAAIRVKPAPELPDRNELILLRQVRHLIVSQRGDGMRDGIRHRGFHRLPDWG